MGSPSGTTPPRTGVCLDLLGSRRVGLARHPCEGVTFTLTVFSVWGITPEGAPYQSQRNPMSGAGAGARIKTVTDAERHRTLIPCHGLFSGRHRRNGHSVPHGSTIKPRALSLANRSLWLWAADLSKPVWRQFQGPRLPPEYSWKTMCMALSTAPVKISRPAAPIRRRNTHLREIPKAWRARTQYQ